MDYTKQIATLNGEIAAVEARIEANTEAFENEANATYERRVELTNQIREDAAKAEALKGQAVRAALLRLT